MTWIYTLSWLWKAIGIAAGAAAAGVLLVWAICKVLNKKAKKLFYIAAAAAAVVLALIKIFMAAQTPMPI